MGYSIIVPVKAILSSGAVMPSGFMSVIPVFVPYGIYSGGGPIYINTLSAAGNVKVALYAWNAGAFGGALAAESAAVSTAATGTVAPGAWSGGNKTLAGWYWAAALCDNATATFVAMTSTNSWTLFASGTTTRADLGNGSSFMQHYQLARTYAAGFPATLTAFSGATDFRSTSAAQCVPLLVTA